MRFPNFFFEKKLWKKDFKFVAGLDEVGRGSFAGPVVAGCVVFRPETKIPKNIYINDSKKLTKNAKKNRLSTHRCLFYTIRSGFAHETKSGSEEP